jgi:4-hydroxy-3-polyprenylbenzoate decarboxylase
MRLVIGISGASGAVYAITLLKNLNSHDTHLIISENGKKLIEHELGLSVKEVQDLSSEYYENSDLTASISSGSFKYDAMVIIPCSTSTLSKIAVGITDNLITRSADVCLKEHRKLVLVPRETPLNSIHIENMAKLSRLGVVILPAMPAFYSRPETIEDMVNFVVGKILDVLGIENDLFPRWGSGTDE